MFRSKILVILVLAFVSVLGLKAEGVQAQDGSLYLSPPSGVYEVGDDISLDLMAEGSGTPIGGAEAELLFDPTVFQITAISQADSLFNYWTIEPSYSNQAGTIQFAGGSSSTSPETRGKILTLTGRITRIGPVEIEFKSGAVIAFDGKGTNIIKEMTGAALTAEAKSSLPPGEFPNDIQAAAPSISSLTHPDESLWYPRANAAVFWDLPARTLEVRTGLDQDPEGVPRDASGVPISEKTFEGLADGTWYFHVQVRTSAGWSKAGHFRMQIDTRPPEYLKISHSSAGSGSENLVFDAHDATSAVIRYIMEFEDGEPVKWQDDGSHTYLLTGLSPGIKKMSVGAVDSAGNELVQSLEFEVAGPVEVAQEQAEESAGLAAIISGISGSSSLPVLGIFAGLLFIVVGLRRVLKHRRQNSQEDETNATLAMLSGDLNEQLEMLKTVAGHRPLSREEDILMSYLGRKIKELEE